MKLTDLEPRLIARDGDTWSTFDGPPPKADGIIFLCPVCFERNAGPIGTHSIICWQPHVPREISPGPGRWPITGASFADLSLSPSISLPGAGCKAHFFVTAGEVRLC